MRKIGIQEIEDIALGATLLGAGGGGDPYIGKLTAIGAVKECGEVELIGIDEEKVMAEVRAEAKKLERSING